MTKPGDQLMSMNKGRKTPYVLNKYRRGKVGNRNEEVEFWVDDHGLWYRNEILLLDQITAKIPKEVAVLTIMGEKDNLTTVSRDRPLWIVAYGDRDHVVEVLPGADHYYLDKESQERCSEAVTRWLLERVGKEDVESVSVRL